MTGQSDSASRANRSTAPVLVNGRNPAIKVTEEKRQRFISSLVDDNMDLIAAAKLHGIRHDTARAMFREPAFRREYDKACDVLRSGQRHRNIHTMMEIRDDEALKETAAGNKTRLDAAKALDGTPDGGNTTINVGGNATFGYVFKLNHADQPRSQIIDHQSINKGDDSE